MIVQCTPRIDPALRAGNRRAIAGYQTTHFQWQVAAGVGAITLHRPERKSPLAFGAYAELCDLFKGLRLVDDVHAVVVTGAWGNFCSGGDVHEINGPLTRLAAPALLAFTRMTGDLIKQIVKAFVVRKPGVVGDAACVLAPQDFAKACIAPHKYPRALEFRASLPRAETGKLQRFKLRSAG